MPPKKVKTIGGTTELGDRDYIPVCDAYFEQENKLVVHQIESYNAFINEDLDRIIKQYTPFSFLVERLGDTFTDETRMIKFFRVKINFKGVELVKPHVEEVNGKITELYPSMARSRHFTYQSPLSIKLDY